MITRTCLIFLAVLFLATGQTAVAGDLSLSADRPTVPVQTRSDGRNFIRLPALQYTVRVGAVCDQGRKPARLSLNVADTRVLLNAAQIVAGTTFDVPLLVPSSQIGPIAVEGFCLAESPGLADDKEIMTVPSVLSIQASLLCESETGDEIDYASTALDVTLECARPQEDESNGGASITSRQVPTEKFHSP
jgi:hypothetical protein